jgi:Ricin-type beta-trefoil lectin domain
MTTPPRPEFLLKNAQFYNIIIPRQIQSVVNKSLCVTASQDQLKLSPCKGKPNNPTPFQHFQHTFYRDIEHMQELCFDASNWTEKSSIMLFQCHYLQGNQYWRYDRSTKRMFKNKDETVCLDCDVEAKTVFINECDGNSWSQLWEWGWMNQTLADNWLESGAKIL